MPKFDSSRVQKYAVEDVGDWMEYSGFELADVVNEDEDPAAKLGALGFTRSPKGAQSEFQFAYDEVLIVTQGRCTIRSGGETLSAGPGETLYLPAGVAGQLHADEDLVIVYVASSPYGEVNKQAKAELLGKTG